MAQAGNGNHSHWNALCDKLEVEEAKKAGYIEDFWKNFKSEMVEARQSSLWEDAGKGFEQESKIITSNNIKMNIPLHVFMNPTVKFIPYLARIIWKRQNHIPRIIFTTMQLQCIYCTSTCKTVKEIKKLFHEYLEKHENKDEVPYKKEEIDTLDSTCKAQTRII